jgi:hypothetical protein
VSTVRVLLLCLCVALWSLAQQSPAPEAPPGQPKPEIQEQTPPPQIPAADQAPQPLDSLVEAISGRSRNLLEHLPPPPQSVVSAIIGFVALLVLAYLGGHPKVVEWERRLNIAHITTTGLPFLFLGFLASQPLVGILTPSVLREIAPLLPLGLGWIGFVVGSRFSGAALEPLAPGVGAAVVLTTAVPFGVIFGVSAVLLLGIYPLLAPAAGQGAVRDAFILAAAGTMAARSAPHFFASFSGGSASDRIIRIIELEQLAGILGLMVASAFVRPSGAVAWQLPGTAWLFVIFGIGAIMGIVITGILSSLQAGPQFTTALLGAVAFTAGMASYLRLAPIGVCCITSAILINLGGPWKGPAGDLLARMERPVYFVFLVVAGAIWRPWEWQGWVLMFFFVTGRFFSKWLATVLLERFWLKPLAVAERWTLARAPMGALSVAFVVSAQDLYSGPTVGWIVTAVIGGTILMEATLQLAARRGGRVSAAPEMEAARVRVD